MLLSKGGGRDWDSEMLPKDQKPNVDTMAGLCGRKG
jgi:hypothetical protein